MSTYEAADYLKENCAPSGQLNAFYKYLTEGNVKQTDEILELLCDIIIAYSWRK